MKRITTAALFVLLLNVWAIPVLAGGDGCATFHNHSGHIPGSYDYANLYESGFDPLLNVRTNGQDIYVPPPEGRNSWDKVEKCHDPATSTTSTTTGTTIATTTTATTVPATTTTTPTTTTSTTSTPTTTSTTTTSSTSTTTPTTSSTTLPTTTTIITTTTVPETTTSSSTTTTTVPVVTTSSSSSSSSTDPPTTLTTLPATGIDADDLTLLGAVLILTGLLAVVTVRAVR